MGTYGAKEGLQTDLRTHHFENCFRVKKTYMNNVPTTTPKTNASS